jgi:curved DNA-binding protein CbpA
MNNPYETLGVKRTSNVSIVRNKYIQLAKKYHPDTSNSSLQSSEDKMKQINNAYDLIKSSISRVKAGFRPRGKAEFRPRGRFTKKEINELIERYIEGQSLYKIGRDMKRKQRSIRRHLENAGLMEDEYYNSYKDDYDDKYYKFILFLKLAFVAFIVLIISWIIYDPQLYILESWFDYGIYLLRLE